MSLADWTSVGTPAAELDAGIKYAGNSSVKMGETPGNTATLTHNTFSENKAQITLWGRRESGLTPRISCSSYGDLACVTDAGGWEKWRLSFWYDVANDTKWGRREKWVGGEWVQQGGDVNFGAGMPGNGSLVLKAVRNISGGTNFGWFDELDIQS